MSRPVAKAISVASLVPLCLLLSDFAAFADVKGLHALVFIFRAAIMEGAGIVLLISIFFAIINSQNPGTWAQGASAWLFGLFAAESRLARSNLIVACLDVLMVARVIIIVRHLQKSFTLEFEATLGQIKVEKICWPARFST
jgi:hypothetical protein